ncbi:MAG: hypothetical protein IPJ14_13290 [Kineosporiaceae bacterium]|jgi:hypothetical protein|nr:hypothetical protein [Kineosporiaceae bacterium]MBK7623598.1 hypothetical protein [Kineosporiaceae bacterium]MBK8077940.1 hypothetical protein [Kineosporiaceae bacterium]
MARFAMTHVMTPEYSFGASFEVGLDLVLDGLARLGCDSDGTGETDGTDGRRESEGW